MHIVYIIESIENSGGMERVLAVKANYLANKGYSISIITQKKNQKKPFFFFNHTINIYELDVKSEIKPFVSKLNLVLNQIKPDILISTGSGIIKFAGLTSYPCKKIMEWHFAKYTSKLSFYTFDKYLLGKIYTKIYYKPIYKAIKSYDKFVTLTNEDRLDWGNLPNIITISNPLTISLEKYADLSHKRVIAVGRLEKQKAFNELIDIWKEISTNFPDWNLAIFGEGKRRDILNKQIIKNNLQHTITLFGNSPNIQDEYSKSSIYAMTSAYEGQPLVLIEAMKAGLPTIAYACKCGPSEVIHNGKNGFLVPVNNKKEYIEKLSLLMTNENLRISMSEEAKISAQNYDLDTIMQQWENLFNNLVSNK